MICEHWQDQIDLYVDREQNPSGEGAIESFEEHLRSCSGCNAEVLRRMQLKRAVRAAGARYAPPAELRRQVRAALAAPARSRSGLRLWIPVAALVTALILAVGISTQSWLGHAAEERAIGQLVDMHVTTTASANPVDVVSTDRHTVKPWFQGKLPFTFDLPDLENRPYKLLGGRVVYFAGRPGAQLLFAAGKHELSLFIVEEHRGTGLPGSIATRRNGFSVETWTEGDLRYAIVSDANAKDVRGLRDLLGSVAGR